jgi:hypothetical protein
MNGTGSGTSILEPAKVALPEAVAVLLPRVSQDIERVLGPGVVRVTPLSYDDRRFSRLVRAAVSFADGRPATAVYLKIFKVPRAEDLARMQSRVAHEFATTRRAFEHLSKHPHLGAVYPIACYPEHLAIVTEETPGHTLLSRLVRDAAGFPQEETLTRLDSVLARTGQWIRAFQTMPVEPAVPANERLADYIDIRLRRLVELPAAKFSAPDRAAVLEHVNRLEQPVGSDRQVPVHADLAPANVLISGERIVVLDFAMSAVGHPLLDLARLYMQIDLLRIKPRYRSRTIRRIQASLLRGFDPSLDDRAPAFRLRLLRYHVNHLNTLAAATGRFPASAYNSYVRRFHRRWIANEVASADRGPRA